MKPIIEAADGKPVGSYGRGRYYVTYGGEPDKYLRSIWDRWQTFGADHFSNNIPIKQGQTLTIEQDYRLDGSLTGAILSQPKTGPWGFRYGAWGYGQGGKHGTKWRQAGSFRFTIRNHKVDVEVIKPNGKIRVKRRKALGIDPYVYSMRPVGVKPYGDRTPTSRQFVPGEWHRFKIVVKWNTGDKFDGSYGVWQDGKLAVRVTGVRWFIHKTDAPVFLRLWLNGWRTRLWPGKAWFDVRNLKVEVE